MKTLQYNYLSKYNLLFFLNKLTRGVELGYRHIQTHM